MILERWTWYSWWMSNYFEKNSELISWVYWALSNKIKQKLFTMKMFVLISDVLVFRFLFSAFCIALWTVSNRYGGSCIKNILSHFIFISVAIFFIRFSLCSKSRNVGELNRENTLATCYTTVIIVKFWKAFHLIVCLNVYLITFKYTM